MGCGASKPPVSNKTFEPNLSVSPTTVPAHTPDTQAQQTTGDSSGAPAPIKFTRIDDLNRPMPSMLWDPARPLIPPQSFDVHGRITVVLDLDETLIHAEAQQSGPPEVTPRPHVSKLLEVAGGCAEVVVWTSSSRLQAHYVVRTIDPKRVVRHCVYKHRKWMPANPRVQGYTKDLRLMGRDMERILIVENTPDCILLNPANGVLVEDFVVNGATDNTLLALAWIIQDLCASGKTVPNYLCSCPLLHRREVRLLRTREPFMALCMDSVKALDKWNPTEIQTSVKQSDDLFTALSDRQNSGKLWDSCFKDLQDMGLTKEEMETIPSPPQEEEGENGASAPPGLITA